MDRPWQTGKRETVTTVSASTARELIISGQPALGTMGLSYLLSFSSRLSSSAMRRRSTTHVFCI